MPGGLYDYLWGPILWNLWQITRRNYPLEHLHIHQKKLINIRNAASGFKIRQLESQESRWKELQKLKTIDNLTIRDAIKRVVSVATNQGEMFDQDHKCIDLLTKIITSDHKFNDLSIKSLMSEDDYQEVKNRFESSL